MKNGIIFLLVPVLSLALSACGKPGNSDAYQALSSNCSKKFVSEYNTLTREQSMAIFKIRYTSLASKKAAVVDYKSKLVNFKNTYADVKCKAEVNGKKSEVDVNTEFGNRIKDCDDALQKLSL